MMEEQPVKPGQTMWEWMEQEGEARLASYDPKRLKEIRNRWVASSEENETATETQD